MNPKFRTFTIKDLDSVIPLVKSFYTDTPGNAVINDKQIKTTFEHLSKYPEKGTIIVFEFEAAIIGYAIILKLWSNEFSKDIVFIDELFVKKKLRNRGIGSDFIKYLVNEFKNKSAVLILAIEQGNEKAKNLYKKLGFQEDKNQTLIYPL